LGFAPPLIAIAGGAKRGLAARCAVGPAGPFGFPSDRSTPTNPRKQDGNMACRSGIRPEWPAPHPLLSDSVQRGGICVKKKNHGVVARDALPRGEEVLPSRI